MLDSASAIFCSFFSLLIFFENAKATFVVVETNLGLVRGSMGITSISRLGRPYYQFLGVPFAKPPLGNLRFELPEKPDSWTGIKDVLFQKPPCLQIQMITGRKRGSENCLYLNLWSPRLPKGNETPESALSTLVWIHGGGFMSGDTRTYGPKYFMDENVIFVSISYRVGSFGFLSTGDKEIRGNMGLHDQNAALIWVSENIIQFGGHPEKITLFGESSGASAVHWHILSERSRGLFQRAISESGSAIRRYPNTNNYIGQARSLALRVGCSLSPDAPTHEVARCLKNADENRIVQTHRDEMETWRSEYAIYGPIVEAVKDEKAFITDQPDVLLSTGNYNKIPWLSGINSADGIIYATGYIKDLALSRRLDNFDEWISQLPRLLRYDDVIPEKSYEAAQRIREFYFGNELPSNPKQFKNLINLFSDRMYYLPNFNAVHLQAPQSPVYLYYFDYQTVVSLFKVVEAVEPSLMFIPPELQIASHFIKSWINETILGVKRTFHGAAHADEIFLLFNVNPLLDARPGTADFSASRIMVKAWSDFAKVRPSGNDILYYDQTAWTPGLNQNSSLTYLKITNKGSTLVNDPVEDRMRFWKSLNLSFLGNSL